MIVIATVVRIFMIFGGMTIAMKFIVFLMVVVVVVVVVVIGHTRYNFMCCVVFT